MSAAGAAAAAGGYAAGYPNVSVPSSYGAAAPGGLGGPASASLSMSSGGSATGYEDGSGAGSQYKDASNLYIPGQQVTRDMAAAVAAGMPTTSYYNIPGAGSQPGGHTSAQGYGGHSHHAAVHSQAPGHPAAAYGAAAAAAAAAAGLYHPTQSGPGLGSHLHAPGGQVLQQGQGQGQTGLGGVGGAGAGSYQQAHMAQQQSQQQGQGQQSQQGSQQQAQGGQRSQASWATSY